MVRPVPRVARLTTARQDGFTYLWVLAAIAVIGIGLAATSEVWTTSARREKSEELDWIGGQFTQAIGSYYQSSPGLQKSYPKSLRDLIEDRRFVFMRRHLRTVYRNPFTGASDWDSITATDGTIKGVRAVDPATGLVREFVYLPASGGTP